MGLGGWGGEGHGVGKGGDVEVWFLFLLGMVMSGWKRSNVRSKSLGVVHSEWGFRRPEARSWCLGDAKSVFGAENPVVSLMTAPVDFPIFFNTGCFKRSFVSRFPGTFVICVMDPYKTIRGDHADAVTCCVIIPLHQEIPYRGATLLV